MSSNSVKSATIMESNDLLLFDEQFSVADLQESIASEKEISDSVIDAVRKAVKRAADLSGDEESRYVVDFDDNLKKAIDVGDIKLDTSVSGEIYAQLRENGHYGRKLPIKKELIEQGGSAEAVKLALQMDVIREQLKEIISALGSIEGRVTEVLQGQQNDRLGLFYSGLSLYIEARSISDKMLQSKPMTWDISL